MKILHGDIWTIQEQIPGSWICIPTNEGFTQDGRNIMGRGLARQAAIRFPALPRAYGEFLSKGFRGTVAMSPFRLIMAPVKPCLANRPWLSWNQPADLKLIESSVIQLRALTEVPGFTDPILIVPFGCGNGRLKTSQVMPILQCHLTTDQFILVLEGGPHEKR